MLVTVLIRAIIIVRCKGCGAWVLTAFWGTLFQLAITPFTWMEGVGKRVRQMMESEAGREPEDDGPKRQSISMEDLRRKYPWWPSSIASKGPSTLIEMDPLPEEEEKLARGVKSTKL